MAKTMRYIINESQKVQIISALRFAADIGNARASQDWNRLADYLEVLEAERESNLEPSEAAASEPVNSPPSASLST